jgi:uncharacterized RDD family membrane protein YckC
MGSALLNTETADSTFAAPADSAAAGTDDAAPGSPAALRRQAAERLAAHRSRRGQPHVERNQPRTAPERPTSSRSARIAAAVAERYAHTQSYRAFLAAEAERAVQQARAAAEIAALNAQAVAATQQSLLDSFDQTAFDRPDPDPGAEDAAIAEPRVERQETHDREPQAAPRVVGGQPEPEHDANGPVELSLWPDLDAVPAPRSHHQHRSHRPAAEPRPARLDPGSNLEPRTSNPASLTVRLYEDAATGAHVDLNAATRAAASVANRRPALRTDRNDAEARALDEEIAFRHAPVFEEPVGPPTQLPANLIEFPRQLVAPRKARPRLAEGPLRDDAGDAPADGQLRIFEVDPAQISTTPADSAATDAESADPAPQWTSIWLDAEASTPGAGVGAPHLGVPGQLAGWGERLDSEMWVHGQSQPAIPRTAPLPHVATIGRRVLAAAINGAIVFSVMFACAAVFVMVAGHVRPWQPAAPQSAQTMHAAVAGALAQARTQTGLQLTQLPAAVAVAGCLLLLLYQALFFWLSTGTPGMRCARIALCTFDDENPTRKAMRLRVLAVLLSACPLGLGFLWAALDEERLGWHDRICKMYQRSY